MGLFGRREPLHERLAREGGPDVQAEPEQIDPRPAWQETGVHGIARAREWDATVTVDAPDVEGDRATFVALPDGSLLVEDDSSYAGDRPKSFEDGFDYAESRGPVPGDLSPLAAAVEEELPTPYRARAVRQGDNLWAVQARRIEVIKLQNTLEGDTLDVTHTADGTELKADGVRVFGSVRELDERGAREGRDYSVHAERLDGDLWEVKASAL